MKIDDYAQYFTPEIMMGPNSMRLLGELLEHTPDGLRGRVLDLGCGRGLTTLLLAKETCADTIYATDLWIPARENYALFQQWGIDDRAVPMHANALDLPYADGFFDAMVSVDAYHYFGCADALFADKFLPLLKPGATALLAMPGFTREPTEADRALLNEWAEDEAYMFRTAAWWKEHIAQNCADRIEVEAWEAREFRRSWQDWIDSGHEFARRDAEFLRRGLWDCSCFVMLKVTKRA